MAQKAWSLVTRAVTSYQPTESLQSRSEFKNNGLLSKCTFLQTLHAVPCSQRRFSSNSAKHPPVSFQSLLPSGTLSWLTPTTSCFSFLTSKHVRFLFFYYFLIWICHALDDWESTPAYRPLSASDRSPCIRFYFCRGKQGLRVSGTATDTTQPLKIVCRRSTKTQIRPVFLWALINRFHTAQGELCQQILPGFCWTGFSYKSMRDWLFGLQRLDFLLQSVCWTGLANYLWARLPFKPRREN